MRIICHAAVVSLTGVLGACASNPDVVYSYFFSQSKTAISITQTVDCNEKKTALVVESAPSVKTVYSANRGAEQRKSLRIKDLDGAFVDSDVSVSLYDDGRLKGLNATSVGQGEAVLKSAIAVATAVAPLVVFSPDAAAAIPECTTIATEGRGEPVTLIYSKIVNLQTESQNAFALDVADESKRLYALLRERLPLPQAKVIARSDLDAGATYSAQDESVVMLPLQKTQSVDLQITAPGGLNATSSVIIPGSGTYQLPIPKAALFGKRSFTLSLSEAGAITAIGYARTAGASGALNVMESGAKALTPQTTAQQAAEAKDQADLIAQQQRLARCRAKPAECQ